MKVYLASLGVDPSYSAISDLTHLANISRSGNNELVSSPDAADVILFSELHQTGDPLTLHQVFSTDTFKRYGNKCYGYDQRDYPGLTLPGLVVSVPRSQFRNGYHVAAAYYGMADNPGDPVDSTDEYDYLFSFVGSSLTHRCRREVLSLRHPRGLVERVDGFNRWDSNIDMYEERRKRYADSMRKSAFVICPRGHGTSTFRLYEAMAAGRAPVIISDEWVPPKGVNLDDFAIRWPESQISSLPRYLEARELDAVSLGMAARDCFETRFADTEIFDWMCNSLEELVRLAPWGRLGRLQPWRAPKMYQRRLLREAKRVFSRSR